MTFHFRHAALATGLLSLSVAAPLAAQKTKAQSKPASLDRTVVPTAAKDPELHVPSWTKTTLPNGAQLIVSEKRGLPLVSFQISFVGGAYQYEAADKTGTAALTAAMLAEGTTHRTGDQITNDLQLLGTNVLTGIAEESGRMSFQSTADKFEPTLAIVADLLEHPIFPADAVERARSNTLVGLTQDRDRTPAIATAVFPKVLYTTDNPYGRVPTPASVKTITRDDVVAFYKAYFTPGHAIISVVGDVKTADVKRIVEQQLAGWTGGSMPAFNYPAPAPAKPTTIYLVDKPGAQQSSFALGEIGPPRSTPDYFALRVLNTVLGGMFQSRLNHNVREVKGWSYGVGSTFAFGRGPGAFRAGGDVVTAHTDSALIEFLRELKDIRGPRPPTDDELSQAKASLVQSMPGAFASVGGINGNIASLYTQGLPEDYFQQFARGVNAVTKDDVVRVAQKYIDPDHLSLVIVGDRAKIEGPLAATSIARIVRLDVNGDPIPETVRP